MDGTLLWSEGHNLSSAQCHIVGADRCSKQVQVVQGRNHVKDCVLVQADLVHGAFHLSISKLHLHSIVVNRC